MRAAMEAVERARGRDADEARSAVVVRERGSPALGGVLAGSRGRLLGSAAWPRPASSATGASDRLDMERVTVECLGAEATLDRDEFDEAMSLWYLVSSEGHGKGVVCRWRTHRVTDGRRTLRLSERSRGGDNSDVTAGLLHGSTAGCYRLVGGPRLASREAKEATGAKAEGGLASTCRMHTRENNKVSAAFARLIQTGIIRFN